ncbi:MAG: haloacid dehalogenase type II [Caldilineaceae bacterium]|nr:haloacid dehalogenase type II [Caldilineaceae bacterium]MDE0181923.1 haloacid dehalogenase type II [Caldilineaceae bacterium]
MKFPEVKAFTFDIFGTVVDWRGSIIREGRDVWAAKGVDVDWEAFADSWRGGYEPAMQRVRAGELHWMNIDALHRLILEGLLEQYQISSLSEGAKDQLNRVWHRLDPWPDVAAGLERIRRDAVVAALSNGNVALLVNMARHGGLCWDCVLSAELAEHYKPDPEVYQTAAALLGLEPHQVMMVAAHNGDLKGARAVGFRTAFVHRPREYGPSQTTDLVPDPSVDVVAKDFMELADLLGCQ